MYPPPKVTIIGFFLFVITYWQVNAQDHKLRFEHITVDQGLPDNAALCSMQDSKGFLWFGTWNGLCKYDGYNFTTYQFDPDDTASIGGNVITRIFEDRDGTIWVVAHASGIYLFERTTEKFVRFNPKPGLLSSNYSISWVLNEDKEGKIWTGNDADGQLVRYDKKTGTLDDYTSKIFANQDSNTKKDRAVGSIYKDRQGTLWIGSSRGLHRLNLIPEEQGKPSKLALLLTCMILKIQRAWLVIPLVQYMKIVEGCFGLIAIVS